MFSTRFLTQIIVSRVPQTRLFRTGLLGLTTGSGKFAFEGRHSTSRKAFPSGMARGPGPGVFWDGPWVKGSSPCPGRIGPGGGDEEKVDCLRIISFHYCFHGWEKPLYLRFVGPALDLARVGLWGSQIVKFFGRNDSCEKPKGQGFSIIGAFLGPRG